MNQYDNPEFFAAYAQMSRSQFGLDGAGEWHQLKPLFPELTGKTVLDLGCGYGWHCKFAADNGAAQVLGIDQSERMIDQARRRNAADCIEYRVYGMDDPRIIEGFVHEHEMTPAELINELPGMERKVFKTLCAGGIAKNMYRLYEYRR